VVVEAGLVVGVADRVVQAAVALNDVPEPASTPRKSAMLSTLGNVSTAWPPQRSLGQ